MLKKLMSIIERVIPKRLIEEGYQFAYPQCADALKQELQ